MKVRGIPPHQSIPQMETLKSLLCVRQLLHLQRTGEATFIDLLEGKAKKSGCYDFFQLAFYFSPAASPLPGKDRYPMETPLAMQYATCNPFNAGMTISSAANLNSHPAAVASASAVSPEQTS